MHDHYVSHLHILKIQEEVGGKKAPQNTCNPILVPTRMCEGWVGRERETNWVPSCHSFHGPAAVAAASRRQPPLAANPPPFLFFPLLVKRVSFASCVRVRVQKGGGVERSRKARELLLCLLGLEEQKLTRIFEKASWLSSFPSFPLPSVAPNSSSFSETYTHTRARTH